MHTFCAQPNIIFLLSLLLVLNANMCLDVIPFPPVGDLSGNGKTNTDDESAVSSKPKAPATDGSIDRGLDSCEKGVIRIDNFPFHFMIILNHNHNIF